MIKYAKDIERNIQNMDIISRHILAFNSWAKQIKKQIQVDIWIFKIEKQQTL